jgi:hypothetical protein
MRDRRTVQRQALTDQPALRDRPSPMHGRHSEMLEQTPVSKADLESVIVTLRHLERFWANTGDLSVSSAAGPQRQAVSLGVPIARRTAAMISVWPNRFDNSECRSATPAGKSDR